MVTANGASIGARECSLERRDGSGSSGMDDAETSELDSVIGCIPNVLSPLHHQEICDQIEAIGEPDYVHASRFVRFRLLLDIYHTQPNLLDPVIATLVESLLVHVNLEDNVPEGSQGAIALSYIHYLAHIRGYKVIIRHLPHEVFYMEKLLNALESRGSVPRQDLSDDIQTENYTNNALLMWLYIVAKNPFDLMKFDEDQTSNLTMKRIVRVTENFLTSSLTAVQFSAALILSHVATRSDGVDKLLPETMRNCLAKIHKTGNDSVADGNGLRGCLLLICAVLKMAKRTDVVTYAPQIFDAIQQFSGLKNDDVINHLITKLYQRVGLLYLKPKIAKWRYSRGSRFITDNLKSQEAAASQGAQALEPTPMETDEDEEDCDCFEDIPEGQLEAIIDVLMRGLCHKGYRVRYSAAKGVGRVASRLPHYMAKDIVTVIMSQNFNDLFGKDYWHGGCMALAELTRRGCILPEQLGAVVPLIKKALIFEEPQGRVGLGENVRDAACYICWAFARAYEPVVLAPFIQDLATELVNVALFDRQITVRRAASAAYQENVGRLGTFPNGISVLQIIDFFSVGKQSLCFGELCTRVAQHSAYSHAIGHHLTHLTFRHWDEKIRDSVAHALKLLVPIVGDEFFLADAVAYLLQFTAEKNISTRHGAICALSGIIAGLKKENLSQLPLDQILQIPEAITKRLESRTSKIDASLLMKAASKLVLTFCEVGLDLTDEKLISLVALFDRILSNDNECIRESAIDTVKQLYECFEGGRELLLVSRIKDLYFAKMRSTDQDYERAGAILSILCLPLSVVKMPVVFEGNNVPLAVEIVHHLNTFIYSRNKQLEWILACKYATRSVAYLVKMTEIEGFDWDRIFDCLMCALENYARNEHGDVGSHIRGVAIKAFEELIPLAAKKGILTEDQCSSAISGIVQQASERINWLRKNAFGTLAELVKNAEIPIKEREELSKVVGFTDVVKFHEGTANERVSKLLSSEAYGMAVLHGLMISAGDLSESTRMGATQVLLTYVESIAEDLEKMEAFVMKIVTIFSNNVGVVRITTPIMMVVSELLNAQLFLVFEEDADASVALNKLVDLLVKESVLISKRFNAIRKRHVLSALCGFLQFDPSSAIWKRAFEPAILSLRSQYPPSRREGAVQIYEALMGRLDIDENTQKALDLLSETRWYSAQPEDMDAMKAARIEIKGLLLPNSS